MGLLDRDRPKLQTQLAFHWIRCDFALTYYSLPADMIALMAQDPFFFFFSGNYFAPRTIFKPAAWQRRKAYVGKKGMKPLDFSLVVVCLIVNTV